MTVKTKPLTQHVIQERASGTVPVKRSSPPFSLKHLVGTLLRRINTSAPSLSRQSKQHRPHLTAMAVLLAGRYLETVSLRGKPETTSPPQNNQTTQTASETSISNQRARLLARLGIRSQETTASPEDIELLIASLSHIEEQERINAAHSIADLYDHLLPEKQMHARINLILMAWRDASAYARIAAIKALARTKTPDVSEALQVALRDEEQDVRAAAARALGELPGKAPIVALVAAAQREQEHWSVRAAALRAMGELRERAFLNTITRALEDDDDSVRIAAIGAVAQVEGIGAAPRLALIAQRERQPHVKHAAILALEDLSADDDERHRK